MRSFLFFFWVLLLVGCKSDSESNTIRIFHSVPSANELTVEINGETQDQTVTYGMLSDEFELEIGSNTLNLISQNANTNPVATFEGEIDSEENLTIIFTGKDEETQKNSFSISSDNLPDPEAGEAYVRFIQGSQNGDSIRVGLFHDSVSTESMKTDLILSYSDNTEFINIPVELGRTSSYIVRIFDKRENKYFDKTFIIRNEEIISFLYYGNSSVIGGFEVEGFIENFRK